MPRSQCSPSAPAVPNIARHRSPNRGSGPRWLHTSVYDAPSDGMIAFGGANATFHSDVWVLSNASSLSGTPTWTNTVATAAPGAPPPRRGHTAVYDAASNRMIAFGGEDAAGRHNDVWLLLNADGLGGTPTWTNTFGDGAPGLPLARRGHAAIYDAVSRRMMVFGVASALVYNDVWVLSNARGSP